MTRDSGNGAYVIDLSEPVNNVDECDQQKPHNGYHCRDAKEQHPVIVWFAHDNVFIGR